MFLFDHNFVYHEQNRVHRYMKFTINLSSILVVLTIYMCLQCDRKRLVEEINNCMKTKPAEICIKLHKGL